MPKAKEEMGTVPEKDVKYYRVFDARANLVAQVTKEAEAQELAAAHKGFYKELA